MTRRVLVGTVDGVYHVRAPDPGDATRVLDCGDAVDVRVLPRHGGVFAATETGLHWSRDGGASWTNLHVPRTHVYAVAEGADGGVLYAGTRPAHLYASTDAGASWVERDALRRQPSHATWHTPRHGHVAHVRSLGVHPDAPDRVVAGIEVGGVHVSDDRGVTWTERRAGLQDDRDDALQYDVHHVLMTGADAFLVACGGGLYRTRDAGKRWTRLDADGEASYFHASVAVRDLLVVAAETFPPGPYHRNGHAGGVLLESTDGGDTLTPVPFPGGPRETVTALTADEDHVLAGTSDGRLIIREDDAWVDAGRVPDWVRNITVT